MKFLQNKISMKSILIFFILLAFTNCSFDNKSGIWSSGGLSKKENDYLKDFKKLSYGENTFDKIIPKKKDYNILLTNQENTIYWKDIYFNETNNSINFKYTGLEQLVFKSRKLSKNKINNNLLFDSGNVITSDNKGNLIIFSINKNQIINQFNFYKKKFKKIDKFLNIIIENGIIYISDNIGYIYAFNYLENKILWAKNYKIPFKSNLKIYGKKLITSNQNNDLYIFDKDSGEIIKLIPTEETKIKNDFKNNLSIKNGYCFFLNTYGSLYAINLNSQKIDWYLNLNQSLDLNPNNLFMSNQIVNFKKIISVSSNDFFYILDSTNGNVLYKKNFSSLIRPIIINNNLFTITKNNLLISINIESGEIIYSYDINSKISDFLNIRKKSAKFKYMMIANDTILIFLENSYMLKLNINGEVVAVKKMPSKLKSPPIFIESKLIYLNSKNKISVFN